MFSKSSPAEFFTNNRYFTKCSQKLTLEHKRKSKIFASSSPIKIFYQEYSPALLANIATLIFLGLYEEWNYIMFYFGHFCVLFCPFLWKNNPWFRARFIYTVRFTEQKFVFCNRMYWSTETKHYLLFPYE
jgi:hypothetical protein